MADTVIEAQNAMVAGSSSYLAVKK